MKHPRTGGDAGKGAKGVWEKSPLSCLPRVAVDGAEGWFQMKAAGLKCCGSAGLCPCRQVAQESAVQVEAV